MNTPITAAADLRKKEILIAELREQILHLERERIVEFCDLKNENTTLRESCIELENKMAAAHNDARHLDSLRSENTSLLERIKELEIEKEGIQTAQAAMAEAMESTRKRMHRMQQIFGNLTMAHKIQCEAAQAVVDRWETPTWKDAEPTAAVIYRLRDILANVKVSDAEHSED